MKKIVVALLLTGLLSGCESMKGAASSMTQQTGGNELPEASAGYQPAAQLPFPKERVFQAALDTLDDLRITVLTESKDAGRITTDYVAGPTQVVAFGLLGGNSVRYKYTISVKQDGKASKLTVTAFLESSGNKVQSWRDVSADNQQIVTNLQNFLTEKISKKLGM